jgi:cobalt-zinc-cadmium efflux system outer membrane protein
MSLAHEQRMTKIPTIGRCLFSSVMLALVNASSARAQALPHTKLSEQTVIERALARPALHAALQAEVAVEEGRRRAISQYPNPQLSYLREQTFGALGTVEDYLSLAQTVDLPNRRGLAGEAAEARVGAATQSAEATRVTVATVARQRFYEALYRQERASALAAWTTRIDEALAIVARREQHGDAALYDRRRLERERAVAASRQAGEHATLERARAKVAAIAAIVGAMPAVAGVLLPSSDPPSLATLQSLGRARPDLRALDLQLEAANRDQRAVSRWWLPDLRIEGGWKGVRVANGGGRSDGFLLGASVAMPLWDRSVGNRQIAEGEARSARARRALQESELDAELEGARSEAVRLRQVATELSERARAISDDLVRIASAGYEGGELGLLELLDAYRGAADDWLAAVDMAHAARQTQITLDSMIGAGVP